MLRLLLLLLLLLLPLAFAAPLIAQQPAADSAVVDTVAPGLVHTYVVRQEGPWRAHVVRVDLRSGQYAVRSVRALDSLRGRETVSGMVERARRDGRNVRVAINADFFNLGTGESVNNQVGDGRIWRALAWSGVPRGPMRSARGQFGVTRDGRPVIDRFVFTGTVHAGSSSWALDGVNVVPSNGQGLVLWLPEANGRYRADSARTGRELRVTVVSGNWRDSLMLRARGRVTAADSVPLPANEGALVAYGFTAARLDSIARVQGTFDVHASWLPSVGAIDQLVGGWPVILRDRVTMVEEAARREFTVACNANVRHPRSLVGFDADTSHLYLVAVDGRSAASVGMTLVETADFLRGLGVAHALNLDGGGSTALVVDGRVINTPSDPRGERMVANALLIEERRRPK
ncbi:MAG: hypothetical protein C0497_09100 [Gemmatimonas sp.]|nr:hypothetical protein [Gemmatimonas sp.]